MAGTSGWNTVANLADRTVYHVDSERIGDRLEVTVVKPFPGAEGLPPLPAIYVLDPIACLDVVTGVSRIFDIFSRGAVPFKYVIGIGYPTADQIQARRFRDLTPVPGGLPAGLALELPLGTGGGPKFLASIAEEIIPGLAQRHNLDPANRLLTGYSLSARFVLHVLFARPDLFGRYLVASPSFWWADNSVFGEEAAYAASHADLAARLFLSVGAEEHDLAGAPDWRNDMTAPETMAIIRQVESTKQFIEILKGRRYPSLRLLTAEFPGERHITVFPAAASRGISELYA